MSGLGRTQQTRTHPGQTSRGDGGREAAFLQAGRAVVGRTVPAERCSRGGAVDQSDDGSGFASLSCSKAPSTASEPLPDFVHNSSRLLSALT